MARGSVSEAMSYATIGLQRSPVTKTVRKVVPWLVLLFVMAVVFSAFGRYQAASKLAATQGIPPSLLATGTASSVSGAGTAKAAATKRKKYVVVVYDGLNFRKEPNRVADSIRSLDKGDKLTWLASMNGWYKVRTKDGTVGWVAASKEYTKLVVKGR